MEVISGYFLLFITYAFIGWCIEVVGKLWQKHRFINRGFLIGPWLPIYGYGALVMTIFLNEYQGDPFALFSMSMLLCSVLEYFTSYLMERLFHARWWDYSQYKFNLNGRICLSNAILFGLGGILIIEYMNPILFSLFDKIPALWVSILSITFLLLFLLDNIISFKIMFHFKRCATTVMKDSTEEISKRVRRETGKISEKWKKEAASFARKMRENKELLGKKRDESAKAITERLKNLYHSKSYLYRRLVDAFPDFKAVINIKIEKKVPYENTQSKRSKNKK